MSPTVFPALRSSQTGLLQHGLRTSFCGWDCQCVIQTLGHSITTNHSFSLSNTEHFVTFFPIEIAPRTKETKRNTKKHQTVKPFVKDDPNSMNSEYEMFQEGNTASSC